MLKFMSQRWLALAGHTASHPLSIAVLYVAAVALVMFLVLTLQGYSSFDLSDLTPTTSISSR
ncbi:hypothetical protein [Teichococcus vastitatis]|uniref:Uncharacterized protein n=1 Tax=Teichococcus vastitatis TaxID=2307076 RepID=A0ABS9W0D7_9PROT|nr:hypothetical protein [Pseudoroseomonas vastitatis]MCI0752749.1 hypothetical protein [Pseudoroseomonas vastitatis]